MLRIITQIAIKLAKNIFYPLENKSAGIPNIFLPIQIKKIISRTKTIYMAVKIYLISHMKIF